MQKQLTWTFSSRISHEELAGCFGSHRLPLSAYVASEILAKNSFTQDLLTPEDVQDVCSYLSDHFPDASEDFIACLASILSQTDAEQFLLNAYHGANWPLPDFEYLDDHFSRYVSLLSLVLESGLMPARGWPHGRIHLTDFDGNVGAKALAGIEHGGNPLMREKTVDPMTARIFLNDIVDFGVILTGFADCLDDPTWNSWLAVVNATRQSRHEFLPLRRFDSQVSDILTTYFGLRELKVQNQTPTDLSKSIPRASTFWSCLNWAIDSSIPSTMRHLSQPGRRLAGLILGTIGKDPFTSLFVRTDGRPRPLIECDLETWEYALGLSPKEVETAFAEIDDLRMRGLLPFFFNT